MSSTQKVVPALEEPKKALPRLQYSTHAYTLEVARARQPLRLASRSLHAPAMARVTPRGEGEYPVPSGAEGAPQALLAATTVSQYIEIRRAARQAEEAEAAEAGTEAEAPAAGGKVHVLAQDATAAEALAAMASQRGTACAAALPATRWQDATARRRRRCCHPGRRKIRVYT